MKHAWLAIEAQDHDGETVGPQRMYTGWTEGEVLVQVNATLVTLGFLGKRFWGEAAKVWLEPWSLELGGGVLATLYPCSSDGTNLCGHTGTVREDHASAKAEGW